jgi:hypothetical protein
MRDDQSRLVNPRAPIQNQIQVERARGAFERACPASLALDAQQRVQHGARRQVRLPHDDAVQEARLVADAHGRRVVPGGLSKIGEDPAELPDREVEVGVALAQVAAERDRDRDRGYSTQRVPRTTPG